MPASSLPIREIQAEILAALRSGPRLVLVAPTGSGKTTQVPQMLLDAGLAAGKRIIVLQPRRVAARTVAARVARERNSPLGSEVGYQIRFDEQTSPGTKICFVTEGILLRWIQTDPALSDTSMVIFDEFHERNLLSDVALALVKQLQQTARPDLKLVVMSATLDAKPVADYLSRPQPCPILIAEGQSFPVDVQYLPYGDDRSAPVQAADAVERIISAGESGDILVFMPGMAEINQTIGAVRAARVNERLALIPLHGELQPEEQDAAFAPHPLRKVIVSTNVAETSVTIEGIRHVVDSGLARISHYDAERGISALLLEPISRAAADQRKGRAGRTAPGTCHRLWTESSQLNRPERNTPEIQRTDLAEVVLLLHSLGINRAADFDWLDKPEPQAIERAENLLLLLGALEPLSHSPSGGGEGSRLTPIGRQMLRLPMHPRYSRMLVEATGHGCVEAAALCAALVSGRDLLVRLRRGDQHGAAAREEFEGSQASDFFTLMQAFQFARKSAFDFETCRRHAINAQVARQVEQTHEQILSTVDRRKPVNAAMPGNETADSNSSSPVCAAPGGEALMLCITAGFIDQLCIRDNRGSLECTMVEGRRGTLMRESMVQDADLFVAATVREIPGRQGNLTLLGLATAVKREWLAELFPQHLTTLIEHCFDRTHKRVAAIAITRFKDLVIHRQHQRDTDPAASGAALAAAARQGWFELPLFNHEAKQFISRVNLVAAAMPELEIPPLNEPALVVRLSIAFRGLTLAKEAQAAPLKTALQQHLAPEQLLWIEELTPISIPWGEGKKLKLIYPEHAFDEDGSIPSPELQVKLHECFPLKDHPHICEGRLPVKLWLCSPDGKRLEATHNWPAFRANTYPKLKTQLQKKFPGTQWH